MNADRADAGFTLIEMMVSLALFALIAVAGVALVDGILRIQSQTAGRLERLGDIQRAMFVIDNDLGQARGGPVSGTPAAISFSRRLAGLNGEPQSVSYALAGNMLVRNVATVGRQRLLGGITAVRWHYLGRREGWVDHWPPDPRSAGGPPAAVSLDADLMPVAGRAAGTLRRVIALPAQP